MFPQMDLWPESGDEGPHWVGKSHFEGIQFDKNLEPETWLNS